VPGHIKNAVNIDVLKQCCLLKKNLKMYQRNSFLVYCRSGSSADGVLLKKLVKMGLYRGLMNLKGGYRLGTKFGSL